MNNNLTSNRIIPTALLLAFVSTGLASEGASAPVSLSPGLEATLKDIYGAEEGPKLRDYVAESLGKALNRANGSCKLNLAVQIDDAMPSHPTPNQQNAAIDPVRSRSLGGAALTGRVLSADGKELATVKYQHYPPDFSLMSRSFDPWADAHIAMDEFTSQLISACRKYTAAPAAAP